MGINWQQTSAACKLIRHVFSGGGKFMWSHSSALSNGLNSDLVSLKYNINML